MTYDCSKSRHLKIGYILEALIIEEIKDIFFTACADIENHFNACVSKVPVHFEDIQKHGVDKNFPWFVDVLLIVTELSTFDPVRTENHSLISTVQKSSEILLISTKPKATTTTSMDIIHMSAEFSILFVTSLIVLSFLMVISVRGICQQSTTGNWIKLIWRDTMETVWRSMLILFFEPYTVIHNSTLWRVLAMTWLVSALFLYIDFSSTMKSQFSQDEYTLIETAGDVIKSNTKTIIILKNYTEEKFLKIKAKEDETYRKLWDIIQSDQENRITLEDILLNTKLEDFFNDGGMYGIVTDIHLLTLLRFKWSSIDEFKEISKEKLYISKPWESTYVAFPLARNCEEWAKEAITFMSMMNFEQQIYAKFVFSYELQMNQMLWTKPIKDENQMKMKA